MLDRVQEHLGRLPEYARYSRVARNGYYRRNDPTSERKTSPYGEGQTRIVRLRATDEKGNPLYLSLLPGHLLPKLRTAPQVVLDAVGALAEGKSIQETASAIGVVRRTVTYWIRRLDRARARLVTDSTVPELAAAARGSLSDFWRALKGCDVSVLAKLLAHSIVI